MDLIDRLRVLQFQSAPCDTHEATSPPPPVFPYSCFNPRPVITHEATPWFVP